MPFCLLDNKEKFEFDQSRLAEVFGQNSFDKFQVKKEILQLDLKPSNFLMQCHVIKDLLMNKRLFYEFMSSEKSFVISLRKCLRKRTLYEVIFRPVLRSDSTISILFEELLKTNKKRTIDVAYKPFSRIDQIVNCYFTSSIRNAYCTAIHLKKSPGNHVRAMLCMQQVFCAEKKSLESNLKTCCSMPGIVYKFENQNIQTFFDNRKFMGDPPFTIYFDSETTSSKKI